MSNSIPQPHQVFAPIKQIESVAPRHFLMSLYAPTIALQAQAGQFVHVLSRDSFQNDPLLRRAFSLMAVRSRISQLDGIEPDTVDEIGAGRGEIDILFRVEGTATTQLSNKRLGEVVDVIGPLGRPFDLDLFHVKQTGEEIEKRPILVGGGVGVPPLIFLGESLKRSGLKPLMLIGARKAEEIIGLTQLEKLSIETRLATEDGSAGISGRVTQLLETALQNESRAVVYACGPLAMLKAVAKVAAAYKAPCQVSMEENMPCGIGVCNGCVVPMIPGTDEIKSGADYGRYQRVCVAGPAVWSHLVDWESL